MNLSRNYLLVNVIQEADDRLRDLERRTRSGDPGAREALDRARQRAGQGARYTSADFRGEGGIGRAVFSREGAHLDLDGLVKRVTGISTRAGGKRTKLAQRYTRTLRQHGGDPDHPDVVGARARMTQAIERHKRGTGSPV